MADDSAVSAQEAYAAAVAAMNRGDDEEGFRLFLLAEERGDERARLSNAALAAWNAGDEATAEKLWSAGAELECARCLFNLGMNAREDWRDPAEAERLFTLSANGGYAIAALQLAYLLKPDSETADVQWLQRAIDLGLPDAMNTKGVIAHDRGDEEEALKWYGRAAAAGFPLAISNLARCADRVGDVTKARDLHLQAACAGSEFSVRHLLDQADVAEIAEILEIAADSGIKNFAPLPGLWASHKEAELLALGKDSLEQFAAGLTAIESGNLAAAHVFLASAVIGGLDEETERTARVSLISQVLLPLGRNVEAEVWALGAASDAHFAELAGVARSLQSHSSELKGVVRLPENESWRDADPSLAWLPTDWRQTRYDEVVAFAAGGGFGSTNSSEADEDDLAHWLHGLLTGPVRFKFQPHAEVFVAALADVARFIEHSSIGEDDVDDDDEPSSVPVLLPTKKQQRMNIFSRVGGVIE